MALNGRVTVIGPAGHLTPFGARPEPYAAFAWSGIFESGFYEVDDNWAYTSLQSRAESSRR